VLDPVDREVIGCVYLYPSALDGVDVGARSWVRRTHADLDEPLRRAVRAWLDGPDWPFERIDLAGGLYGVAKAATDKLTADIAHELRRHRVAAVSLYPGLVRTEAVSRPGSST
jgi:NAD(P)-dependent dehydrogenase (short-subunit alcohol dehydrogenase family)